MNNYYLINESIYKTLSNVYYEKFNKLEILAFQYEDIKYKTLIDTKILTLIDEEDLENTNCEEKEIELYNCIDSKCVNVKGYLRCSNNLIFKCDDKCSFSDQIEPDDGCGFVNDVAPYIDYSSKFQLCVYNIYNYYLEKEIIAGQKNYVFSYNIFTNSYDLYISNEKGNIIGSSSQEKEMFICLYNNVINDTRCIISHSSGYYLNTMSEKTNELYYCNKFYSENENESSYDEFECIILEKENGYFINSLNTDIIKCSNSKCEKFKNGNSCDNHYNEVIVNNNSTLYFCEKDKAISFPKTEMYIELKNINANVIFPVYENGNDIILLKIDKYSVTQQITDSDGICISKVDRKMDLDCSYNSIVYICQELSVSCDNICNLENPTKICNGYYYIEDKTTNTYKIYKCDRKTSDCNIISNNMKGYFKFIDDNSNGIYFECDENECKKITEINNLNSNCNNAGDLIVVESEIKVCLNSSNSIGFSDNEKFHNYLLENNKNSIFSNDNTKDKIVISVNNNFIIAIDTSGVISDYYLINNKIYSITNDNGNINFEKSNDKYGVFPFKYINKYEKLIEYNEYLSSSCTDSDFLIYNCEKEICYPINAYFRCGSNLFLCNINNCKIFENNNSICDYSNNNFEIPYIDDNSKLKICIVNYYYGKEWKEIEKSESPKYILSYDEDLGYYHLYITYFYGNIISWSYLSGNYYINYDDKNYLMICTPEDSSINNPISLCREYYYIRGYIVNSLAKESNKLLYCIDDNVCEDFEANYGFFVNNHNTDIIKCIDSQCEVIKQTSCQNHKYEIIKEYSYSGYYCNKNDEEYMESIDINNSLYYVVEDIDASSIYPNINSGSDIILLKINKYSITQYISYDPIYITYNNQLTTDEIYAEKVYTCKSLTESCIFSKNECDPHSPNGICDGYYLEDIDENNKGNLYLCDREKITCDKLDVSKTIGYFISQRKDNENNYQYIKCDGKECELINLKNLNNECNSVGELVFDNSYISICIDQTYRYSFNYSNDYYNYNNVIVIENINNNIFGAGETSEYIIVIQSKNKIIPIDMSILNDNIYIIDNYLYQFSKNNNVNSLKKYIMTGIFAFKRVIFNEIEYHGLIEDEEIQNGLTYDLYDILLYHCVYDKCYSTTGYLKYNNELVSCNYGCEDTIYSYSCDGYDFQPYLNDNKINLCTNYGNSNYHKSITETVDGTKKVFVNYLEDYNEYRILLANNNNNIIVYIEMESYYYLDLDDDGINELIYCRYNSCSTTDFEGYFLVNKSDLTNALVFCTSKDNDNISCSYSNIENGIFKNNHSYQLIVCENSICHPNERYYNICDSYSSWNSYQYCQTKKYLYFESNKYYSLENVNALSTFPKIEYGNDLILLKFEDYSITQVLTNAYGICIDYNYQLNDACDNLLYKYTCTDINKSCERSSSLCDPIHPTSYCEGFYIVFQDKSNNNGDLYSCSNSSCEMVKNTVGYFKINDENFKVSTGFEYIKCEREGCIGIDSIEKSYCSKIGELIVSYTFEQNGLYICTKVSSTTDESIKWNIDTSYSEYNILYNDNSNFFGTEENGDYVMIKLTGSSVILSDIPKLNYNNYVFKGTSYTININDNTIYKYNINGIIATRSDSSYNEFERILIKSDFTNDLSSYESTINIYDCLVGDCLKTKGAIKYGKQNNILTIYTNSTSTKALSGCSSAYDIGNIWYDTDDSALKLCKKKNLRGDLEIVSITKNSSNYMFNYYNELCYTLYKVDNTQNIIGLSTKEGYYIKDSTFYECSSSTTGSICCPSYIKGYVFNSESDVSNNFIYCDDSTCERRSIDNGFLLSNKTMDNIILCESSNCQFYKPDTSCTNNNYKIISNYFYSYNEKFTLCLDDIQISLENKFRYYELHNVDAKSVYPNIIQGNDIILLEINQYSIFQYNSPSGICVKSNHLEDTNCAHGDSLKYVCKSKSSCVISQNTCNPKNPTAICNGLQYVNEVIYECNNNSCKNFNNKNIGYLKITNKNTNDEIYINCNNNQCKQLTITPESSINCNINVSEKFIIMNYTKNKSDGLLCISGNLINFSESNNLNKIIKTINRDITYESKDIYKYELYSITNESILKLDTSKLQNNTYLFDKEPYLVTNYGNYNISFEKIELDGSYAFINDKTSYQYGVDILLTDEELLNITNETIPNVRLYYCDKINCNLSTGYLIYKTEIENSYKTAECSYDFCDINYVVDECVLGKHIYYKNGKKKIFCVNSNNSERQYYIEENEINYIFNYMSNSEIYNLYISNKSGTIYVQSTISETSGSTCELQKYDLGYYQYSVSSQSNDFIYCEKIYDGGKTSSCSIVTKENGYFTNSGDLDVIKCVDSNCEIISKSYSCKNHNYEIIFNSYTDTFSYCMNNKEYKLNDEDKYYKLTDINPEVIFPMVEKGEEYILLKIDKYSVTQYVALGICVYTDNTKVTTSNNIIGAKPYTCMACNSIDSPCYETITITETVVKIYLFVVIPSSIVIFLIFSFIIYYVKFKNEQIDINKSFFSNYISVIWNLL
ncbi:hypothetical protein BCR32DRAFT_266028 [Anaeromyces robustus]|uniref:Scaffoldin n=1 Tax=Anaeromyces robustus TaxID=1754192 RepID=A0A1Y1XGJ6_9FUNG|nr:hypothetical protein BCR32DRAFT_266028 [Anaeromyces robustus]|eukprot:ORX84879.1 hypothetical protein BCR32DRAFT_266028 [Anaeromyces robustus]